MTQAVGPQTKPSFGILGPLLVTLGDVEVAITSAMQRRILTALLLTPGAVVSADRLEFVLWGDHPPRTARKNLHTLVSRLRAALDEDSITTMAPGYVAEVAPEEIDAYLYERLVSEAEALLDEHPEDSLRSLDRAAELWRGPALAEFRDEEFASAEAVRLEEMRIVAGERRFDALLALSRHETAIPLLEAFTAEHPYRERPHSQLMTALYRAGRAPDALRVYQRFRLRMIEELGLDPSPDLQKLETAILQQDPALDPPPGHAEGAATNRSTMPAANTRLVGRDRDLASLSEAFVRSRLVSVVGPPGVGKTRLAMAHGAAFGEALADGVRWCELAAVTESSGVVGAAATAIGLRARDAPNVDGLAEALVGWEMLLVLDNCEHVLAGAAELADRLIHRCPRVRILTTSREPLGLIDEHLFPLRPLSMTTTSRGGDPAAVELFLDRALAVEPEFEIDEDVRRAASAICERLDGLPLAIELAAAQLRYFTPQEIAERLEDRFAALGVRPRVSVERHRTLGAAIEWSYDRLLPEEREVFELVAVFVGGFRLGAVTQVARRFADTNDAARQIPELVEKSLVTVERSGSGTRYGQLETLRAFGQSRLESRGVAEGAGQAHRAWALQFAEEIAALLTGPDEAAAVRDLRLDIGNLRAAHASAIAEGDAGDALRLSAALHHYAYHRLEDEIFDWAQVAAQTTGAENHQLYPAVLGSLAQGMANRGKLDEAVALADGGLRAAGGLAEAALQPLHALATVGLYRGELDEAVAHAEREVVLSLEVGDVYQASFGQTSLTLAHTYAERDATVHLEKLRDLTRRADNPTQLAWSEYVTGETMRDRNSEGALGHLRRAVELGESVSNDFVVGVALLTTTDIQAEHGDVSDALRSFARIINHWSRRGDWTHQLTTLRNLIVLLARLGAYREASVLIGVCHGDVGVTPAYGASARRLKQAEEKVIARLGSEEYWAARRSGESYRRRDAVALAQETIRSYLA